MSKVGIATSVAGGLAAVALMSAASAAAINTSVAAPDVVAMLQEQGYTVQFNGTVNGPLSNCSVNGVHGLTIMTDDGNLMMKMEPANGGTVYVDVLCPTQN